MCGIVGVISSGGRSVVGDLGNGAHFLQHRGPAYAGLFVFDPAHRNASLEKGEGLAALQIQCRIVVDLRVATL